MPVSRYVRPTEFEPWPLSRDLPREPKSSCPPSAIELLAFVVIAGTTVIGFALALAYLPSDPTQTYGMPGNWIGQDGSSFVADFVLLLALVYFSKRVILCRVSPSREVMWYVLILLCSLPYIWFFVVLDWFNRQLSPLACWVGYPILVWTIPTVTFVRDRLNDDEAPPPGWYLARSAVEIFFVFPYWMMIWRGCCYVLFDRNLMSQLLSL
jgi:hypothetical protein